MADRLFAKDRDVFCQVLMEMILVNFQKRSPNMSADSLQGYVPSFGSFFTPPQPAKFGCWRVIEQRTQSRWITSLLVAPTKTNFNARNEYILKTITPGLDERRHLQALDRLTRRIMISETVQHHSIPPLLDAELDRPPFYVVEPFIVGRSLHDWVWNSTELMLSKVIWASRQIAEVLNLVHHHGKAHLRLSAHKIIIDSIGKVTVTGWNNSHSFTQRCWLPKEIRSDVQVRAPETFADDYRTQPGADVFSLGSILYWMFSKVWPADGKTVEDIEYAQKNSVCNDLARMNCNCPESVSKLIMKMLAKNPLRRPSIEQVLEQLVSTEIDCLKDPDVLAYSIR